MGNVLNGKVVGFGSGVYIGRGSMWGNRFRIGVDGDREEVIRKYENWLLGNMELVSKLYLLKGKDLVCWCKPLPCHGDVLVSLVNGEL
jgi:hypothetical protein